MPADARTLPFEAVMLAVLDLFEIRSMRIEVNVAYRWFIGFSLTEPVAQDFKVWAGNLHAGQMFDELYKKMDLSKTEVVAVDAGYKTFIKSARRQ